MFTSATRGLAHVCEWEECGECRYFLIGKRMVRGDSCVGMDNPKKMYSYAHWWKFFKILVKFYKL